MTKAALPTGVVTFVFTDIEGSTRLTREIGAEAYAELNGRHKKIIRSLIDEFGGFERGTEGDSFFVAFERPTDACRFALQAQLALNAEPWPEHAPIHVRIGVHTGATILDEEGNYFGSVNETARIESAGNGGQILISHQTAALVQDNMPSGAWLRDLGEFTLKDLRPQRLFQLCHEALPLEFAGLRALSSSAHLPTQTSTFVGRDTELSDLKRLFQTGRLVTIVGPGGAGKTRLALHVAGQLSDEFTDGTWMVDLAHSDDKNVLSHLAIGLGQADLARSDLLNSVIEHLRDRSCLVLFDSCEKVLDGLAPLVRELLSSCSRTRILTTSRERLRLPEERLLQIAGLATTPTPTLQLGEAGSDAMRLFVIRAAAVRPAVLQSGDAAKSVSEICSSLDGLPLAIELAAARVDALSLREIAERLESKLDLLVQGERGVDPRHATLRATIDWSYQMLTDPEKELFQRSSVFEDGARIDAIEAVCSTDTDAGIFELVARLVGKSLLVSSSDTGDVTRYRMLETVRSFATEALTEAGRAADTEQRHATWCANLASASYSALTADVADMGDWLDRLDADHRNLMRAINYLLDELDDRALRMVSDLGPFWNTRGHWREARATLERALHAANEPPLKELRRATATLGQICTMLSDFAAAKNHFGSAMKIADELGDTAAHGRSLGELGLIEIAEGNLRSAELRLRSAVEMLEHTGDQRNCEVFRSYLGNALWLMGRTKEARKLHEEALIAAKRSGRKPAECSALIDLGQLDMTLGLIGPAQAALTDARALARTIGDPSVEASIAGALGICAVARGDFDDARELLMSAVTESERLGDLANLGRLLCDVGWLNRLVGRFEQAEYRLQTALRVSRGVGDRSAESLGLQSLGELHLATGQYATAQDHFEAAIDIARACGDLRLEMLATGGLGHTQLLLGEETATQTLQTALKAATEAEVAWSIAELSPLLAAAFARAGQFRDRDVALLESINAARVVGTDPVAIAVVERGGVLLLDLNPETAANVLACATASRSDLALPRCHWEQTLFDSAGQLPEPRAIPATPSAALDQLEHLLNS